MLTSGAGMCADIERSRFINSKAKEAERNYPGRFIGAAHVHPLGGAEAFHELERCSSELGYQGVVITSEVDGLFLDDPAFEPFWTEASRLGMYVFVHPALRLNDSRQFNAYDTARSVGREFSLVMATIRLINSGVLDRHPNLTIQMAHLGGGIASVIGRIRSYQDKDFWATAGNPRHGVKPERDFDYYIRRRFVFDTAGFCGAIQAVNIALIGVAGIANRFRHRLSSGNSRARSGAGFCHQLRDLGASGEQILAGNTNLLLEARTPKAVSS